jgi:hypothetical protein
MSAGAKLSEALYQGRALREQVLADREKAIARAVRDVLDGTCESAVQAAEGHRVSVEAVRKGVAKARES